MRTPWMLLPAMLLLVAGCTTPPSSGPADPGPEPGASGTGTSGGGTGASGGGAAADEVVLRVASLGGFLGPGQAAVILPVVSVHADGRVITAGPRIDSYPPPALPNLLVRRISPDSVRALVDRAVAAGVGATGYLGQPGVADAPTTRFTVQTATGHRVSEVQALDEVVDPAALTAAEREARSRLAGLRAALTDLTATLGAAAAGPEQAYQPVALAAVAIPWAADSGGTAPPGVGWPGPALPGAPMSGQPDGSGVSCVEVSGDQLRAVLTAARQASAVTPWLSGGRRWVVSLRPLLPDEAGCGDLP